MLLRWGGHIFNKTVTLHHHKTKYTLAVSIISTVQQHFWWLNAHIYYWLTFHCCICRLVTTNLCVSTWTCTEEYCRAEAMGVILGVVDSTIIDTKKNNLLSWLPGVQTDLVGWTSRLRVPCQAWEKVLNTEYNYYTVRPKHWHGLKDLQGF
jgi:hypothetical protein